VAKPDSSVESENKPPIIVARVRTEDVTNTERNVVENACPPPPQRNLAAREYLRLRDRCWHSI